MKNMYKKVFLIIFFLSVGVLEAALTKKIDAKKIDELNNVIKNLKEQELDDYFKSGETPEKIKKFFVDEVQNAQYKKVFYSEIFKKVSPTDQNQVGIVNIINNMTDSESQVDALAETLGEAKNIDSLIYFIEKCVPNILQYASDKKINFGQVLTAIIRNSSVSADDIKKALEKCVEQKVQRFEKFEEGIFSSPLFDLYDLSADMENVVWFFDKFYNADLMKKNSSDYVTFDSASNGKIKCSSFVDDGEGLECIVTKDMPGQDQRFAMLISYFLNNPDSENSLNELFVAFIDKGYGEVIKKYLTHNKFEILKKLIDGVQKDNKDKFIKFLKKIDYSKDISEDTKSDLRGLLNPLGPKISEDIWNEVARIIGDKDDNIIFLAESLRDLSFAEVK